MTLLEQCLQFTKPFEGFRSEPYLDSGGVPTIGYGSTRYENGTRVTIEDAPIDEIRATEIMSHAMQSALNRVTSLVTVEISDDQKIALTDFEYNLGKLGTSTLLKLLNDGDTDGASEEFLKWNHCNGQVLPGLTYRRQKEQELFNG